MEPIIGILGVCLFITGLWKAKHLRVLSKLIKTRPSATQQLELDTDDGELGDVHASRETPVKHAVVRNAQSCRERRRGDRASCLRMPCS